MQYDISYKKEPGRAVKATLQNVDLPLLQKTVLEEAAKAPISPAEQLALLRAESGSKKRWDDCNIGI